VWGLGRMGVVYREQQTAAARQLGVEQPQRLLQDLHVHAVNMLHKRSMAVRGVMLEGAAGPFLLGEASLFIWA